LGVELFERAADSLIKAVRRVNRIHFDQAAYRNRPVILRGNRPEQVTGCKEDSEYYEDATELAHNLSILSKTL
jgi:hypothetical protein